MPQGTAVSGARRRRARQHKSGAWTGYIRALVCAVGVTLAGVLLFALLMQWLKPSDVVIRVFNQVLKLVSILVGVWVLVGRGGEKGLARGAALGLVYMALGVCLYALLSGQQLPFSAYLADLCMGVAGGGIAGLVLGQMTKK